MLKSLSANGIVYRGAFISSSGNVSDAVTVSPVAVSSRVNLPSIDATTRPLGTRTGVETIGEPNS